LTAQVARASNPAGTTAIWVRDRLDGLRCDEDFADGYPRDGRPSLSPAQLATVCVLQFLLGLSDRQAAEAIRCRIDFKYAVAMEMIPASMTACWPTSATGSLKTTVLTGSSTPRWPVSTPVRDLTRLELIIEADRAALEEVAGTSPHLLDSLVDEDRGNRYGRAVRLGKNPTGPKARILGTGDDAVRLLEHFQRHEADRASGPRVQALRQIMVQNYHRDAAGRLRWRTAEKRDGTGVPPSSRAIVSPSLRHLDPLRTTWTRHQLEGIRRSSDRNLRNRPPQRDHGRGRHPRQSGPAWHPHPPGPPQVPARRAPGRRRLHLPAPPGASRP